MARRLPPPRLPAPAPGSSPAARPIGAPPTARQAMLASCARSAARAAPRHPHPPEGHTSCGAIKGAIDNAELGNLTGLLAKIKPAVEATTYAGERTSKNYAFVDAVARKNVELTMSNIRKESPVLAEMESNGAIKIAGAMYNLETGVVEFFTR